MAIYVPLSPKAKAALRDLAQRERRSPQHQAAVILERALESATKRAAQGGQKADVR